MQIIEDLHIDTKLGEGKELGLGCLEELLHLLVIVIIHRYLSLPNKKMPKRKNIAASLQPKKTSFRRDSGEFKPSKDYKPKYSVAGKLGRLALDAVPYVGPALQAYDTAKGVYDAFYPKKEMGKSVQKALRNESTMSTRTAICKKKGNLNKGTNKPKRIKVSRALRKKIGKVIEEKKINGTWCELFYGYIGRKQDGSQAVEYFATDTPQFNTAWQFLPEEFLHAASVMFNNKTNSSDNRGIVNTNNLGITSTGELNTFHKQQFGCNAKFTVKKSSVTYHLKNNTQSTLKVRAYTVSPKKAGYYNEVLSMPDGSFQTTQLQGLQPIQTWNTSLLTQVGYNILGAGSSSYGLYPEMDAKFKQQYKIEMCDILLDPGQSTTFSVQGPQDTELNFAKMYLNNAFQNLQKFSRSTFFIVNHDLIQGAPAQEQATRIGRFNCDLNSLLVEKKFYCKLSVPESAGVTTIAQPVATSMTLEQNQRRDVLAYHVWLQPAPTDGTRIDEEQPATQI